MAETIGALILSAAGASEITGIAGLGTLAGTTIAGISLATIVGTATIIGISIGLNYALRPGLPKPEDGASTLKQAVPPRIRGYGVNRLGGYYMLYEAAGPAPATSYDVIAYHSGRIGKYVAYLLNDDIVQTSADISLGGQATILGTYDDERYSHDAIHIETRIGAPGQTALSLITSDVIINSIWTPAHVGNGIACAGLKCDSGDDTSLYTRVFPRGKPELSIVAECSPCWDPRDPAQNRFDEATWTVSFNPVIQLIDYLTRVDGGMGLDLDVILPPLQLALWMEEADICDQVVDKAGGGSERRYESSGWFFFDNKPEDVIGGILSTCDGWLAESGEGSLSLTVGLYREPTLPPITEKHMFDFSLDYGQADESLVNQLDITFTDPASKYVSVQTEPWRDETSISLTGTLRSQPLDLKWVQSNSQARRLADRASQRLNAPMTGTFTTTLYGMVHLGKRWMPVKYPFVSGLQDCVVEIQNADVDRAAGKITWIFIRISTDEIEAYDPDDHEGDAPPVPPPTAGTALLREDGTQYVREDGSIYSRESV